MPPEELQSLADALGHQVQHFDGYSVVHTPDGPTTVAHTPAVTRPISSGATPPVTRPIAPGPTAPMTREGVPPMLARPPSPPTTTAPLLTPSMQRSRDTMRQAQADQAERHRTELAAESARELADLEAEAGYSVSDPDRFGIMTRTYPDGRTERVGPPGAFAMERQEAETDRLRHTPTGAGERIMPDGTRIVTDASGQPVVDMARLREELAGGPGRVAVREDEVPTLAERVGGAGQALGQAWENVASPEVQDLARPVTEALAGAVTPSAASALAPPPAPAAPAAPARRALGGGRPQPAPMTAPELLTAVAGTPQARQAFDQSIAGLAGGQTARRDPDLVDRQYLVESQRAGLAAKGAQTQARLEQQAEQQRQQTEADRQRAVAGATRAYQNAIARVADARIEPGRWFRDQGAGGTVGATIAVALGALGQALTGSSSNSALEQINRAVEQDIDAQRSEIDSGRAAADLQGNMLGVMRQEFTDRAAADEAARAAMLQQATLQVQEHEAYLSDDEARNNAEALRLQMASQADEAWRAAVDMQSQIDLREAQARRASAQAAADEALALRRSRMGPGTPHITSPQWEAFNHALAGTGGDVDAAARMSFPPAAITPQLLQELRAPTTDAQRSSLDALSASLDRLEAVSGAGDIPGVGLWDSRLPGPEGRQVRQEISNAVDLLARLRSGAAISEDEAQRFTAILGASEGQTEDEFRHGLQIIRSDLGARLGRTASGSAEADRDFADLGLSPVDE